MADFLRNVVTQRQMAQRANRDQQMMMYRMMQARAQEAERQRQAQMQQGTQERIRGQNSFRNELDLRRFQEEQSRNQQAAEERRKQTERLDLAAQRGSLKQGYRWKGANPLEQELIPGGPEEAKLRGAHAEDVGKLQSINSTALEVAKLIDYITAPKNKSGFTSNFGGYNAYLTQQVPSNVPGFARTADVKTALERLEEMAQTLGLGDIRGRSGQSVGSISEKEWPKLGAQLLKLSPRIEEDTAQQWLKDLKTRILQTRNREMQAYQSEWEPTPFYSKDPLRVKAQGPGGPPQGVDSADWDAMTPQERGLWQTTPSQ